LRVGACLVRHDPTKPWKIRVFAGLLLIGVSVLFVKNDTRYDRALLAEVYGKGGQVAEGLSALAEELTQVDKTGKPIAHVYTSVSRWMKEKKVRRVQDGYQKV